ncbi:MAG: hypothetical protein II649_06270 [Kiritimatiellae bacterium]|nr:hypothetical protein [Kiritimatiellia bacterium]
MTGLLHDWWPVAAVALFVAVPFMQLPRNVALPPSDSGSSKAFASFIELDDAAYATALQHARTSWQMRARTQLAGGESRTTAFDFDEPAPAPLSLGREPYAPVGGPARRSARLHAPRHPLLLPPTLAKSGTEGLAEAAVAVPRDADLLALPDSLLETTKEQTR